MIDFARIKVRSGDGGRGAGSFHALKGRPYGKANGGEGGDGGNVIIEATADLNTLEKYRFMKNFKAEKGGNGFSNFGKGARGEEMVLKVPPGTQVIVLGPVTQNSYDLTDLGQRVLVARGGMGGRGNAHLRDEFGRRPKTGEAGQIGELVELTLELKLIADVGLIGMPNAGKSTLISKLTHATPKIAAYPFTTLEANLGVMTFSGPVTIFPPASALSYKSSEHDQRSSGELHAVGNPSSGATRKSPLVIADIPGLIEGASEGRGLGHLFLKHIERTNMLVHLIDMSQVQPGRLWEVYQSIRSELKNHSSELGKKKEIIVLTKADLVGQVQAETAVEEFKKHRKKTFVISAQNGQGLDELVKAISE